MSSSRPHTRPTGTPTSPTAGTGGSVRSGSDPSRPASVPRFEPEVFGKYFLLQRLALGGMAEVVRAKTVGTGGFQKELVVKRILPRLARDQKFLRMFVNEAKITVGLNHPNIAQIFELGEVDGGYFMAMELVDGVQLRDLVPLFHGAGPRLQVDHAVWTVFEALKGLDHAHRATDAMGAPLGIVHCDISPDNVMVTFDAAVKVVDFGIARAATELSNAQRGQVMGKVNYLSPEQAQGKEVDPRTDLYATGVLLYHLVTGGYPYGRFERLDDLVPLVKGRLPYLSIREHDPRLPADLDDVLRKATALHPDQRFPDARSFMVALEEVLYPTPHSAIGEHLRLEVGRSFADRRDRLARVRANDEAVMRILARRLADAGGPLQEPTLTDQMAALGPRPEPTPAPRRAPLGLPRRPAARTEGSRLGRVLASVALGALAAVGVLGAERYLLPGRLLVTSTPAGAAVRLDGEPVPGTTPLVVSDLSRVQRHRVEVTLPGHHPWEAETPAFGPGIAEVAAELAASRGPVHVASEPAGAQVLLDDAPVGRTPMTLEDVDLARPHKISLKRRGYELDEVVLQGVAPGHRVTRVLKRR